MLGAAVFSLLLLIWPPPDMLPGWGPLSLGVIVGGGLGAIACLVVIVNRESSSD